VFGQVTGKQYRLAFSSTQFKVSEHKNNAAVL
jgi:hypothetical protein